VARILFDIGIFSVIDDASAIGVGWKLNFYTAGTLTRISTYTTPGGATANTNPVLSDADGRFPAIWIDDGQSIKWVFTTDTDDVIDSLDNYEIRAAPPSTDPALDDFLAGDEPLPIASGGTGETSAVNAIGALGGLPTAGGTVTGNITRSTKGVHLYWNASGQVNGGMFITVDSDPDPTSAAGQIWMKYA
jgi:hypothetical protein